MAVRQQQQQPSRWEVWTVLAVALVALVGGTALLFGPDADQLRLAGGWVLLGVSLFFALRILRW